MSEKSFTAVSLFTVMLYCIVFVMLYLLQNICLQEYHVWNANARELFLFYYVLCVVIVGFFIIFLTVYLIYS